MISSTILPEDDKILFRLIAAGDETAFREIFTRYGGILHPFIRDMVKDEAIARELVQDVFLQVWLKREFLPGVEKPSSWLYRLAANHALNQLRRRQIEAKALAEIRRSQPEGADQATETLQGRELRQLIHQAVDRLPTQRKKIFRLIREQGLSRKEVAGRLNISENTVKSQLDHALKSIQAFIRESSGAYIPLILLLHCLPH